MARRGFAALLAGRGVRGGAGADGSSDRLGISSLAIFAMPLICDLQKVADKMAHKTIPRQTKQTKMNQNVQKKMRYLDMVLFLVHIGTYWFVEDYKNR